MREISFPVTFAIFLSGCAILPERGVPLERFVHNMSQDLDCLVYCAQMADNKEGNKASFFLKDPLKIELGVTREGRISASASPNVFSLVGLGLEGKEGRVGKLTLKLFPLERCKRAEIYLEHDFQGQKGPGSADRSKSPLEFKDPVLFFEIINGKEYLYVQGQEMDSGGERYLARPADGDAVVTRRIEMSKIGAIRCLQKRFTKGEMPWCKCPKGPEEEK